MNLSSKRALAVVTAALLIVVAVTFGQRSGVSFAANTPTISISLSPSGSIHSGSSDTASATLSGATATAGGLATYDVFSDAACSHRVSGGGTKTVTNGVVPSSSPVSLPVAGTFYFTATYSGDANNAATSTLCAAGKLVVSSSSLITRLTTPSPIGVGGTDSDSATLFNVTSNASGTVQYTVYSDSACSAFFADGGTKTVSNATVPNSDLVAFPNAGSYYWRAHYSGQGTNPAADSDCNSTALTVNPAATTLVLNLTNSGPIKAGGSDSATAAISGETGTASGTITYSVFSSSNCSAPVLFDATPVSNGVSGATVPGSTGVTFPNVGTYYWQAAYSGDGNNAAAKSACTSLIVSKATPTLGTILVNDTPPTLPGAQTHDTATLTNATGPAGGSVTYTVYSNAACSTVAFNGGTKIVVSAAVPNSDVVSFTAPGTFYWKAAYSGDTNNQATTSTCADETIAIGSTVTVGITVSPAGPIGTGETASATATLGGSISVGATGTVTFTVYTNNTCTNFATSAGTSPVSGGAVSNPSSTVTFNNPGTYYWQASYSGDMNNPPAKSDCTSPSAQLVVGARLVIALNTPGPIAMGASDYAHGSLPLNTGGAAGTVTYSVYSDSTCSTLFASAGTKAVTGTTVPDSDPITFPTAGTYYWQASYSGDLPNNPAASTSCNSVFLIVSRATTSIFLNLNNPGPINVGGTDYGSSFFSPGQATATGTVTYFVYSDNACSTLISNAGTKTVSAGTVPDSNVVTFNNAGTFYWQAAYGGDSQHTPSTSTCSSGILVVGSGSNTTSISLALVTPSPISVGGSNKANSSISGATANAGGTVTYSVYSDNACANLAFSGGTKLVTNAVVPTSDPVTFPASGTFYWQASYSGQGTNTAAVSPCLSGQMVVAAQSTTTLSLVSPSPIKAGASESATASLSGVSGTAGGTVTFTVYTENTCTTVFSTAGSSGVTNGAVVSPSSSIAFPNPGTFYWQASYSGDGANTGSKSACNSGQLVVSTGPSISISLASPSPINVNSSDSASATLANVTATAGGTVTFTVFNDSACTSVFNAEGTSSVSNGVLANGSSIQNFNTAGIYYWQAAYSGDANNPAVKSTCSSGQLNVVTPTTLSITLTNPGPIGKGGTDAANAGLSGATASTAGGSVTYDVFNNNICTLRVSGSAAKTVSNGIVPQSDNVSFPVAGTFYWQATYSGDSLHGKSTSNCVALTVVAKNPTSITLTLTTPNSIGVGGTDSATSSLSGGVSPSGTITYTVYTDSACTVSAGGTVIGNPSGPLAINAPSGTMTFPTANTYYWQVAYTGDATNAPAVSNCLSGQLIVSNSPPPPPPSISVGVTPGTIQKGTTAQGTATITNGSGSGGTATYDVYSDAACTRRVTGGGSVVVPANHVVPNSAKVTFPVAGTFYWQVSYRGDATLKSNCFGFTVTP